MSGHSPMPLDDDDEFISPELAGTGAVLARGLRESPELRVGLEFTAVLALTVTVANLITPILVQQIFDHGFEGGFRPTFVYGVCAAAFVLVVLLLPLGQRRL